jgi:hypothetical protein
MNNQMMQKKVCITYDSMEDLLNRQEAITNTLQGYLNRNDNVQAITDTVISVSDNDKYKLTFTLDQSDNEG